MELTLPTGKMPDLHCHPEETAVESIVRAFEEKFVVCENGVLTAYSPLCIWDKTKRKENGLNKNNGSSKFTTWSSAYYAVHHIKKC